MWNLVNPGSGYAYSFNSDRECVIPEAGLKLKLSSLLTQLSWNRDALNLATTKGMG